MRYVALLRAGDVGGRKVEMARLRAAAEAAGFERVKTCIASGNLFFDAPRSAKATIVERLEAAFRDELGAGEASVVVHLQNGRWPSETWLEKLLGVPATGRFWPTAKILAVAR